MVANRMEWATVPSLNSSLFLKGKLWPIPYNSSRLKTRQQCRLWPIPYGSIGWITWQQCRLWPIPYGPSRLNHMATMQIVTQSLRSKQAESHGNNADCDPFPTAQAGWITWQQCILWPIPYGPSRLNHMATMHIVTLSLQPKQAESHGNNADCDPFHTAQAGWIAR
jgi:hypothetical protein